MKKSLLALAVLAFVGAASAQSTVTLFGVLDANVAIGNGSTANRTVLGNSGNASSRLGFRGTEDLGGGLNASFHLEAGVNNDNGSGQNTNTNNQAAGSTGGGGLTFNRKSTVSLGGAFGEVRLGRDYTPHFWNQTMFDPFGTNGVGTTQTLAGTAGGVTAVRASNSIGYFLPSMGGIYGQAQVSMGENNTATSSTKNDGSGTSFRIGYANGPIDLAYAYGETKNSTVGDIKSSNIGASYDLGAAKLSVIFTQDNNSISADGSGYLLGLKAPMGAGEIRAAYSSYKTNATNDPRSNKLALGYVHNLSKRTALYSTVARVSNSGGASTALNGSSTAANNNSSGVDIGVRHSF